MLVRFQPGLPSLRLKAYILTFFLLIARPLDARESEKMSICKLLSLNDFLLSCVLDEK